MATDSLYILKGNHIYNDWFKVDGLDFFARKETYRQLGLLLLSVVFQNQTSEVIVTLSHAHSEVKSLVMEYVPRNMNKLAAGYHTRPFAFEYYPQLPDKHPFDRCVLPKDLPCFALAHAKGLNFTENDWRERDTVKIFGSDVGIVSFAELLLNLSLPHNEQDEFELEGESGFRGVGIGSAEVRLFLPGHLAWTDEHWQESV